MQSSAEALRYPWEQHPGPEEVVEVRPGVLWARLKLPFRLNHVNIYLLADGDGYAMVDAGFGNEETIEAWTKLFEGPLKGVNITRLIVTHSHPDHVGLAGWIVERFNCPLVMSQVEYLQSVYHQNRGTEERRERSGCSSAATAWTSCSPKSCSAAARTISSGFRCCRRPTAASRMATRS